MANEKFYRPNLLVSFYLWFDNVLLKDGEMYINNTSNLSYLKDDRLGSDFMPYSSSYKQWVWDNSITGAQVPNSVELNSTTTNRGTNGLKIDYNNGRAIFDDSVTDSETVEASYSIKKLNVYTPRESIDRIILENKPTLNSRFKPITGPVEPYKYSFPAAFINLRGSSPKGFALGGSIEYNPVIRATIVTDNALDYDIAVSVFETKKDKAFAHLPLSSSPLDEYGDLKNPNFDYKNECNNNSDRLIHVKEIRYSELNVPIMENSEVYGCFLDFTLSDIVI